MAIREAVDSQDNEVAHVHEDALAYSVLRALAEGRVDPAEVRAVAAETVAVLDVDYDRWYA